MPKLLQVNVTANWGSHGRIAEGIGRLAIKNGWDSYISYGRMGSNSESKLLKIGNSLDVYMHVAESRLLDNHGLGSQKATEKFLNEVRLINPDIIHLHNIHGYYINYLILFNFLRAVKIPVIWTFHDCWPFTGHCTHPTYSGCLQWYNHCKNPCPQRGEYPISWFADRCKRNYKLKKNLFCRVDNLHIVTVSKWLEREVRKSFFKDKDIKCIYNGIDTNIFAPTNYNGLKEKHHILEGEKVVLGVASIWEKRKGLLDFYKLREILPSDYRIILIGLSDKQRKSMPDGIIGVNRVNGQNELAAYYSMANIYVNPSQAESFGMTTAEALACGTPVIVYDVTACPEIVDPNTGRVVRQGDTNGLANEIINICERKNISSFKDACRDRAKKMFDVNERYQDYMNLYNSILGM